MSGVIAKVLVDIDPKTNPAAGLFWRAASDLGRMVGDGLSALFESSPEPTYIQCRSCSNALEPRPRRYSVVSRRNVPDFAHCIRSDLAKLREKHSAQQKIVNETRAQIDFHERIDLCKLDREINELSGTMCMVVTWRRPTLLSSGIERGIWHVE